MVLYRRGFTIVELLIAIVVIAILASVTIVSYQGVVRRTQTSSLQTDVSAMDRAQKTYMTLNSDTNLSYDSNSGQPSLLVFTASKGNSIIVRLVTGGYCVYGYNPASTYPTPERALIRSSGTAGNCAALTSGEATAPDGVLGTVTIIGQRLEEFRAQHGSYPTIDKLTDIGLVLKPNNGNASQQQLYCRDNDKAIYLQIDPVNNKILIYITENGTISESEDSGKLSTNSICPDYNISPGNPGYESTGIKNPDF